jgi:hypothetical protein
LVLSLSPGLGPDGLPSPGGYFPHIPTNGSGNNGLNGGAGSNGNAGNPIGMGGSMGAGGARPGSSGSSGGSWSTGGAAAAGHHGSVVQGAGAGLMGNGSCNSNNPSPVSMMGAAAQNSHRSSPCNELLAAAMRSSAHATNAAGELHCALLG